MKERHNQTRPADDETFAECIRRARDGEESVTALLQQECGLDEQGILRHLGDKLGCPVRTDVNPDAVVESFVQSVPVQYAREHSVVAIRTAEGKTMLATAAPFQHSILDAVRTVLGEPCGVVLAPSEKIRSTVDTAYKRRMRTSDQVAEDLGSLDGLVEESAALAQEEDLLDLAKKPPLVRLVNRLFLQALERRASDIHFQPLPECLQVRFRIDGVLHEATSLPKSIQPAVISRVKVMGEMDIAEKRLAQDGRSTVSLGERRVDLRLSSMPTSEGEQMVVRLLDKETGLLSLDELGMAEQTEERFKTLLQRPNGLILVTGPTGSGKTTTLYAALRLLNSEATHVVTLEDPIEYRLEGINQTQVNYKKGVTFADGLRNVLRQDPDVVMVGEIRDYETAEMAMQSAQTGHLVFSTLHTNDAIGAITRLLDLEVEPYLLASTLTGVMAQRLARRVCPRCATDVEAENTRLPELGEGGHAGQVRVGQGCAECMQTGYKGRIGLFELIEVTEDLQEMIHAGEPAGKIREVLLQSGFRTMRSDGVEKALQGTTTPAEVLKVTQE